MRWTLAGQLSNSGRPVILGPCNGQRAEQAAAEVDAFAADNPTIPGGANDEVAALGEVVVLATPCESSRDIIAPRGRTFAGRFDVSCNPRGFDSDPRTHARELEPFTGELIAVNTRSRPRSGFALAHVDHCSWRP